MLDISFSELLLIVAVAVIFIQPKDVPVVIRALARGYQHVRKFMREVHTIFEEVARESGLQDTKRELERETTWIEGDDGDMYESYDITDFLPAEQKPASSSRAQAQPERDDPDKSEE